jgi:hypothetical protein
MTPGLYLSHSHPGLCRTPEGTTKLALEFQRYVAAIGTPSAGVVGNFLVEDTVTFSGDVSTAECALNGFGLEYTSTDKRFQEMEADVDLVSISGPDVRIRVQANLQDDTANDPYTGYVTAVVMAWVP